MPTYLEHSTFPADTKEGSVPRLVQSSNLSISSLNRTFVSCAYKPAGNSRYLKEPYNYSYSLKLLRSAQNTITDLLSILLQQAPTMHGGTYLSLGGSY